MIVYVWNIYFAELGCAFLDVSTLSLRLFSRALLLTTGYAHCVYAYVGQRYFLLSAGNLTFRASMEVLSPR
jgi:hypothetical protein